MTNLKPITKAILALAFACSLQAQQTDIFSDAWTDHGPPIVSQETPGDSLEYYMAPASGIETAEAGRLRNWMNDLRARVDGFRSEQREMRQRVGIVTRIVQRIEALAVALKSLVYNLLKLIGAVLALVLVVGLLASVAYARFKKRLIGI